MHYQTVSRLEKILQVLASTIIPRPLNKSRSLDGTSKKVNNSFFAQLQVPLCCCRASYVICWCRNWLPCIDLLSFPSNAAELTRNFVLSTLDSGNLLEIDTEPHKRLLIHETSTQKPHQTNPEENSKSFSTQRDFGTRTKIYFTSKQNFSFVYFFPPFEVNCLRFNIKLKSELSNREKFRPAISAIEVIVEWTQFAATILGQSNHRWGWRSQFIGCATRKKNLFWYYQKRTVVKFELHSLSQNFCKAIFKIPEFIIRFALHTTSLNFKFNDWLTGLQLKIYLLMDPEINFFNKLKRTLKFYQT